MARVGWEYIVDRAQWDDTAAANLIEIGPEGVFGAELVRATSDLPGPWMVSVAAIYENPLAPNPGVVASQRAVDVFLEWGHGRARYETEIDQGQTVCVQGSFVSVSLDTVTARQPVYNRYVGLISPAIAGGATPNGAILTRSVICAAFGGIGPLVSGNIPVPAFATRIRDSGGWNDFVGGTFAPILPGREFDFRTTGNGNDISNGTSFVAGGVPADLAITSGATDVVISHENPTGLLSIFTTIEFTLALC